jgi:uracil-DNA glycosylase
MKYKIPDSWLPYLTEEMSKPYMIDLVNLIQKERAEGKIIFPDDNSVFEALKLTSFQNVKVVILGQDPYHGEGQAHGLSFSVNKGVKIPPSLINIYKELSDDLKMTPPQHGNLEAWAKEGVLLLNTVLTVESSSPGSHHGKGWEKFTDKIIELLNERKNHLVFILWGNPAQKKASIVDKNKHLILKSVHPSPLSFYRGFLGSKPFSKTNAYLNANGIKEINWSL